MIVIRGLKTISSYRPAGKFVFLIGLYITAISLSAQTLSSLFLFDGSNGAIPAGGLVRGLDGYLYGTTSPGGANDNAGTIFKVTPTGDFRLIYNFCPQAGCPDGRLPIGGLVQTTDGSLYGITNEGGSDNAGTIFKFKLNTLTLLHSFNLTDGSKPSAGLTQDFDADFYGVTTFGGASNNGTIFRVTRGGSFTLLHSFGGEDGANPSAALVQAANGDFFGTTYEGGAQNAGSIFKISRRGAFTSIYSFCSQASCADGLGPLAGLVQGSDGDFYGTTYGGGGTDGLGTIFKITPTGVLTTLYRFDGTNGFNPQSALVLANDGNLYGVTPYGGSDDAGTLFKMSPEGDLTTLGAFCGGEPNCSGGMNPSLPLLQDTNGKFYGVTGAGGPGDAYGTVFAFSDNLSPFVETVPNRGAPGALVRILGTNLATTIGVSFDEVPAPFAVVSSSEILTSVPLGAKSGTVQVVTRAGTISSNVEFRVQ